MTKVSFRTNILLKSIIGKDLITDDNIAVLELVKNSFDSGSKIAEIIFRDIETDLPLKDYKTYNNSKIILCDLGCGMSEYDLINKWLNIAYSEKKDKKEDFNRQLAGNKGVGRFSCDRLGKSLVIYTRKEDEPLLKLSIDWTKFEKINDIEKNIQDVDFELDEISIEQYINETQLNKFDVGTTLFISNLREVWDISKIQSLKRQLERFINPNQNFEAESFDVKIVADEFKKYELGLSDGEKINGTIKNRIFSNLDFKSTNIKSSISKDGTKITTVLRDRGVEIFTLEEKNPFDLLRDIEINIYYLNPYSKAYFTRQTGIRSVDFGSIFLFINGFRIPPYGDQGNDWLGMELRKGQGFNRFLGTREVIGRIEINGVNSNEDEDDFFIISNRSGVDNNKHFEQLTRSESPYGYYYKTFRRLERFVVEGINWDSVPKGFETKIENKILNDKNWNESKEEYREDLLTRNKRVISIIEKIINIKSEDIISLSINRALVSELADEQARKSQAEIDSIVGQLNNKTLSSEQVSQLLKDLNRSEKEIENFPGQEDVIELLKEEQNKLKLELERKLQETKELEEVKKRLEEDARHLQEALEVEKEKNTFLKATTRGLSADGKGLVHNVKHTSKNIRSSINGLITKIKSGSYKEKDILDKLEVIKFNNEKVLKISKIITRANFKTDENSQVLDVAKYIEQYLSIYSDIFDTNDLNIVCNTHDESFVKRLSALDISLILDDLISNSQKAGAKNIIFDFSSTIPNELKLKISDDGKGVSKRFLDNPKAMFELGVSEGTYDGSGIGLFSVRRALKPMQAEINFIGNEYLLKGATFEITFRK